MESASVPRAGRFKAATFTTPRSAAFRLEQMAPAKDAQTPSRLIGANTLFIEHLLKWSIRLTAYFAVRADLPTCTS